MIKEFSAELISTFFTAATATQRIGSDIKTRTVAGDCLHLAPGAGGGGVAGGGAGNVYAGVIVVPGTGKQLIEMKPCLISVKNLAATQDIMIMQITELK